VIEVLYCHPTGRGLYNTALGLARVEKKVGERILMAHRIVYETDSQMQAILFQLVLKNP